MAYIDFKDKEIFLQVDTTNGIWTYKGHCDDVVYLGKNIENIDIYYIEITDMNGKKAGFNSNNIKLIKEEK